jgi:hypothetical protein
MFQLLLETFESAMDEGFGGAFTTPQEACYVVHGQVQVETQDECRPVTIGQ